MFGESRPTYSKSRPSVKFGPETTKIGLVSAKFGLVSVDFVFCLTRFAPVLTNFVPVSFSMFCFVVVSLFVLPSCVCRKLCNASALAHTKPEPGQRRVWAGLGNILGKVTDFGRVLPKYKLCSAKLGLRSAKYLRPNLPSCNQSSIRGDQIRTGVLHLSAHVTKRELVSANIARCSNGAGFMWSGFGQSWAGFGKRRAPFRQTHAGFDQKWADVGQNRVGLAQLAKACQDCRALLV